MASDAFKKLVFGFVLVSLFSVLLLTSVSDSGSRYDKDTTQITGQLEFAKFNESINEVQGTSQNLRERFEKQSIWSSVAGVVVSGVFGITKTLTSMILAPFVIIANVMENVFFIPPIVTNVVMGLLGLSIIFGIWALIRVGQ